MTLHRWIVTLALAIVPLTAAAQYPTKPILFVVPFAAGGDSDLSGRNLAQHATRHLNNRPIVIANRVGASGSIGSLYVKNAAKDGYTLLIARIASHAIYPAVETKAPYRPDEFTMISLLELNPYVCVVKGDAPYKSMRDLVDAIRKQPGKLNFATSGVGTIQNFGPQYLFTLAGLSKDHAVGIHYKGGGEVTTSLLGGQVNFACNNLTTLVGPIKNGQLRALLVTTPQRLPDLPETQTAAELGWPNLERITGWTALMGPPGMDRPVLERWTEIMAKIAADPDWIAGNARFGGIPAVRSPAETGRFVRDQFDLYSQLARSLGIRE